jgi:hypothetical protein
MTVRAGRPCHGAPPRWRHPTTRTPARSPTCTTRVCRTPHQGRTALPPATASSKSDRQPSERPCGQLQRRAIEVPADDPLVWPPGELVRSRRALRLARSTPAEALVRSAIHHVRPDPSLVGMWTRCRAPTRPAHTGQRCHQDWPYLGNRDRPLPGASKSRGTRSPSGPRPPLPAATAAPAANAAGSLGSAAPSRSCPRSEHPPRHGPASHPDATTTANPSRAPEDCGPDRRPRPPSPAASAALSRLSSVTT